MALRDAVAAPAGPPSVDDVRQIAAMEDAIVRNLRITLAYHELGLAVAGRYGGVANWCTFATWASRQAGQTIRGEDPRGSTAAGQAVSFQLRRVQQAAEKRTLRLVGR